MRIAVLISIQTKWCELIASGAKTIEVRKTAPKLPTPYKCYIYETLGHAKFSEDITGKTYYHGFEGRGKVIGEFICDGIQGITYCDDGEHQRYQWIDAPAWAFFLNQKACLNDGELKKYLGNNGGYGWHISELKMYDEPKELSEYGYIGLRQAMLGYTPVMAKRPPQSWLYVEELAP